MAIRKVTNRSARRLPHTFVRAVESCAIADQVVITSGAQQALDPASRIFLSENDYGVIEDPCYLEARSSFSVAGLASFRSRSTTKELTFACTSRQQRTQSSSM
jgi:DNA-binding transcriptional MocR family regulator